MASTLQVGLSTNQRPGWIRRFFPAKRFVTQESDSTRVFILEQYFFLLLRVFNLVIHLFDSSSRNCDNRECYAARVEPIARRAVALYPANHHRSLHFPARTPGKARGAGGTRVAGTSRTSPLVAGRARARPRSRAPRPSRGRILIGRSARDETTETPRRLAHARARPRLSPSSRWARRPSSPPGARRPPTAATRWRSRRRRCPTARWRRSGSSRPTTEARTSSARAASGRVGTRPRRWVRRPCGACAGTRRARSASAPRATGWRSRDTLRGRSGSGGTRSARRRGTRSPRRGARASSARPTPTPRATRLAARRRVWVRASETRASRKVRSAWGTGASRSKNRSPPPPARPANGARALPWSARETTSATRTSSRERVSRRRRF